MLFLKRVRFINLVFKPSFLKGVMYKNNSDNYLKYKLKKIFFQFVSLVIRVFFGIKTKGNFGKLFLKIILFNSEILENSLNICKLNHSQIVKNFFII